MNIRKVVEEESKILVNYGDYDLSNDKRLLIPFIVPMNAKGQTNKIGFLNKEGEIVVEPIFDIVVDDCYLPDDLIRVGVLYPYGYLRANNKLSSYVRYLFGVIDAQGSVKADTIYDSIIISTDRRLFTVSQRSNGYSVIDKEGKKIVPFRNFNWIDGFDNGLARVAKDGKWGLINQNGEIVLPIEYDTICCFYGKGRSSTKVIRNDVELEIHFDNLGLNK